MALRFGNGRKYRTVDVPCILLLKCCTGMCRVSVLQSMFKDLIFFLINVVRSRRPAVILQR